MIANGVRNAGFDAAAIDQQRVGMRLADSLEVTAPDRPPALTLVIELDQLELRRRAAAIENEYSHSDCSFRDRLWHGRINAQPLGGWVGSAHEPVRQSVYRATPSRP